MYLLRHIALICLGLFAVVAQAEDRGTILSEYWLGIPGNPLTGLTTDARYPASPSGVSVLTSFQTPVNTADSYGTRVRGFLYPPVTGAYRFWVAGDDQCELWLSTSDSPSSKVLIANTYSWTNPQEWTKYASQQSVEITLQAGSRYYIESLHKEGGGGDSLAVAWEYPGVTRQVIPGEFLAPAAPAPVPGSGTGYVLREWWNGLTGTAVTDLTAAPAFPASPTARDYLTTFETPANWGDNYGTRVRGFLRPTQSGTYFFWISGDDGCQLWLSQDAQPAQKGLIASVPGHTATREWTKYPQQKSIAIDLQAGASYYIEALHKEGGGGDIVSVAWTGPGIGDTPTVITGNYLSPSSTENPPTPVGQGSGTILVETWNDIPGNNLSALTAHPYFPTRPSARGVLTQFKSPVDAAETYARRIRGYVCPTITGNYRFWLASDDEGSLRLSTDENPANAVVIASLATWSGVEQWDKFPTQQSVLIPLTGGQRYYIEAMQKEGNGGDHVAVAWVGPSLIKGVIPGAYLAPVVAPVIEGTLEFTASTTVTISATGTGGSLRYTTDGTTPTAASTLYTAPFGLTASTVVKAVHVTTSGTVSEVVEQAFLRKGTGTGLAGSYFANEYLGGQPVHRLDPVLQFNWGTTAPISGIPVDHFSARWQGEIETHLNEEYTLILRSDDGVRVWLDGTLVINDWTYHGATDRTCVLPSGRHTLAIEYMEGAVQAELQMFWQSAHQVRTIVPSSQLYPLDGVQGIIPPTSPVSPTYVEVTHSSGASITATVAGNAFPTNHLDDTIRYFNVPLDPAQPTAVAVSSGPGAALTGDITWAATDVVGNTETVVRKGDSLLLQFPQAGSLSITNYSGTYLGPIAVTAGQRLPVLFSKAGEFTVRLNSQGVEVATLDVTVVTADLAHTILCEVGFTRDIGIDINPFEAPLTFVGNSQLIVTTEAIAQDLASLHITPLRRGTPRLQARIHGAHGPLVAEQAIDEFTIDNAALHSAAVNAQTGIGTVTLVMRPYIPKQIFTMTMFAHAATFKGGATSLTINSTGGESTNGEPPMIQKFDTTTNETIGVFRFDLEIPENESKYCFRVARIQEEDEAEGGAYMPNFGSIFGVQASLPPSAISLLLGSHTGGGNGPTTNVNGDVCHILAYASVIFTKAVDSSEDEINESSNSEQWSSRTWSLVTADYCEKGKKGDGNCNAVSYKLKVSDPPSFGGRLDNQLAALFGGSNKESDCKTCTGSCGAVSPAMDSGTIPGQYTTSIEVCSTGDNDTTGDAVGGVFYVSKLDAYGSAGSDTASFFPKYAETLRRRKGTYYDPVIRIDAGGDGSVSGCSLYGWSGEPFCVPKNKWSFTAIARDPEHNSPNVATSKGFSVKWQGIPGHAGSTALTLEDVSFPVGRHTPRLEIWYTDPNPPQGTSAEPKLISYAEIHSIVVEPYPAANCGEKNSDVAENLRSGTKFKVRNDAGGQTVDAKLSIAGHVSAQDSSRRVRGRVSLDGYPQNEYWVGDSDAEDLPQVAGVPDGADQEYYLQGYDAASDSLRDLTLRVEGQALLEACLDCSPFLLTTVTATWQTTDEEKFSGYQQEYVGPSDLDDDKRAIADSDRKEYGIVPLSEPNPTVEINSISEYDVQVSGGSFTFSLSGKVFDPIADNVPRGGGADIESLKVKVNGDEISTITVDATDDGAPGFWRQHPYRGTFSQGNLTAAIPEGGFVEVTAVTSKNAAGMAGEANVSIKFEKNTLPGSSGSSNGQLPMSIYFPSQPTASSIDSIKFYYANRAPAASDPQLVEAGQSVLAEFGLRARGLTTLSTSQVDHIQVLSKSRLTAALPLLTDIAIEQIPFTVDGESGVAIETAVNSRVFIGSVRGQEWSMTIGALSMRSDGRREYEMIILDESIAGPSTSLAIESVPASNQYTLFTRTDLGESSEGSASFSTSQGGAGLPMSVQVTGTAGSGLLLSLQAGTLWVGNIIFEAETANAPDGESILASSSVGAASNSFNGAIEGAPIAVSVQSPIDINSLNSITATIVHQSSDAGSAPQKVTLLRDPGMVGLYHANLQVITNPGGGNSSLWYVKSVVKHEPQAKGPSIPTTIRVRGLFDDFDKVDLSVRDAVTDAEVASGMKLQPDKVDNANYLKGGSNGFVYFCDDPESYDGDDILIVAIKDFGVVQKQKAKLSAYKTVLANNWSYPTAPGYKGPEWLLLGAYLIIPPADMTTVDGVSSIRIREDATMPPISASIVRPDANMFALYFHDVKVTYVLTINWTKPATATNPERKTSGTYSLLNIDASRPNFPVWDVKNAMGTEVRGGTALLTTFVSFPAAPHDKSPLVQVSQRALDVRGRNPTPQAILAHAHTFPNQRWYYDALIQQESTTGHFERDGLPKVGPNYADPPTPGGFGVMQIDTPPPTDQEIWDWKANIARGMAKLERDHEHLDHQTGAKGWFIRQVDQQTTDGGPALSAQIFTFGGVNFQEGTGRTATDACAIWKYNGKGRKWPIYWDRPSRTWKTRPAPYIEDVVSHLP